MDFFSAISLDPPYAILVAKGELDALAAVELRPRLDEAVDRGCIHFRVDTSAVRFVDAGGLGLLVRLRNVIIPFGGSVVVTDASPRFRQIADLVGLGEAFDLDLLPDTSARADLRVASIRSSGSRRAPRPSQALPPPPCETPRLRTAR